MSRVTNPRILLGNRLSLMSRIPILQKEYIHYDKDNDEEEEGTKQKTFKEEMKEMWDNPRNKKIILLLLGAALISAGLSENLRDIAGVEFFMYRNVGISDLETMIEKRELASVRILAFTGDFNDEHKALLTKTDGSKRVLNIANPDSFLNHLSELQTKLGVNPSEHVPFILDHKTPLYKNLSVTLRVAYQVLFAIMLGVTFLSVRRFIKEVKSNISGRSTAIVKQFQVEKNVKVKFADVAGMEESKREIQEFVDFLKNPKKYHKLGAKIPRGALMYGPPGTGKTMLAKACAGEAGVSFFYTSGSEFVEMYGGVGASRVRSLFKEAKENSPAIIFIDEIDAIGRKRESVPGGSDERDSTLNQLLVELDGFGTNQEIVLFAATNRKDILDPALTRAGRFDRAIEVNLPDIDGRVQIFKVHLRPLNLNEEEMDKIAKRLATITPGFSGSDIANICNEAAILSARAGRDKVIPNDFEQAVDRVIGGLELKRLSSKKNVERVALHESGHGVVSWFLEGANPLLKLTIVPRSKGSLGYAQYLPPENSLQTEQELYHQIATVLGGRLAEEEFFGDVTTGAYDDLEKAYKYAHAIVTKFGMSPRIGLVQYPDNEQGLKSFSEETNQIIDEEIMRVIKDAEDTARKIIHEKRDLLKKVSELLLEKETIDINDLIRILGERPFPIKGAFKRFMEEKQRHENLAI